MPGAPEGKTPGMGAVEFLRKTISVGGSVRSGKPPPERPIKRVYHENDPENRLSRFPQWFESTKHLLDQYEDCGYISRMIRSLPSHPHRHPGGPGVRGQNPRRKDIGRHDDPTCRPNRRVFTAVSRRGVAPPRPSKIEDFLKLPSLTPHDDEERRGRRVNTVLTCSSVLKMRDHVTRNFHRVRLNPGVHAGFYRSENQRFSQARSPSFSRDEDWAGKAER
jgi:hypothetical protein